MNDSLLTRTGKALRFVLFQILHIIITSREQFIKKKTLLIVRLDSIGDYILVQNLFSSIKKSIRYHDYKVTLCGNKIWRELAEIVNKDVFDSFIWIDRDKFHNSLFHKYQILKNIYLQGFEVVIDSTFSREMLFGDSIVKISNAPVRIGSEVVADSFTKFKRNILSDSFYTRLIPDNQKNIFEFYRIKEFFEVVLEEKIQLNKIHLDCSHVNLILPTQKSFAVIFPGAQDEKRRWSTSNFEIIIDHLIQKYNLHVIIAGSKSDSNISRKMVKCRTSKACFDMTGRTTLPQLAKLISQAEILISNETSAVHFAAAVGTAFICISNGNNFGRFNPYPKEMNIKSIYVYPDEIEKNINDFEFISNKYRYKSKLEINSINPTKVVAAIELLL